MDFASRPRHSGYTGGSQERVDLLFEKEVHELGKKEARGRGDTEGDCAQGKNTNRFRSYNFV